MPLFLLPFLVIAPGQYIGQFHGWTLRILYEDGSSTEHKAPVGSRTMRNVKISIDERGTARVFDR